MTAGRKPVIGPAEQWKNLWQAGQRHQRERPACVTGDFDKGIGSGEPASIGSEQVHLSEKGFIGHTDAFRRAGSLQGDEAETETFQQPGGSQGGTNAQRTGAVVEYPSL